MRVTFFIPMLEYDTSLGLAESLKFPTLPPEKLQLYVPEVDNPLLVMLDVKSKLFVFKHCVEDVTVAKLMLVFGLPFTAKNTDEVSLHPFESLINNVAL